MEAYHHYQHSIFIIKKVMIIVTIVFVLLLLLLLIIIWFHSHLPWPHRIWTKRWSCRQNANDPGIVFEQLHRPGWRGISGTQTFKSVLSHVSGRETKARPDFEIELLVFTRDDIVCFHVFHFLMWLGDSTSKNDHYKKGKLQAPAW